MVEVTERLEVGGGLLTSAFIIVCRGIESIDCAFLRCDNGFLMLRAGGLGFLGVFGGEVETVVVAWSSLPDIVE
jgi:hypothetical protein